MRWYNALGAAATFGFLMGACGGAPSSPTTDTMAYQAVLKALQDSLGAGPVWVQPNPIRVGEYMSAPGNLPEHYVPNASGAIAEAVASNSSQWRLCSKLGEACFSRPTRGLALSELKPDDAATSAVWATYVELFSEGREPWWQIRYYRVTLHWSEGRWIAGAPELLGGEP